MHDPGKRRSLALLLVLVVALGAACLLIYRKGQEPIAPANILSVMAATSTVPAASQFRFEVVTTPAEQERGLGGRPDVPQNYGMLFVFPADDDVGFWMKDMLVPIDIIWLSDTGSILGIEDSVATSTYPNVFYPPQPVRYVLETRAGEAARQGWTVGTDVMLPLKN